MPLSDIHYGNTTCDVKKVKRDLSEVGDKHIILGIGDWLDSIIVKDAKRYAKSMDASKGDAIIDEQIDELAEIVRPAAKQIVGLGDGNHEEVIIRQCGTNPIKRLCEKLSTSEHTVKYLGYSWLLRLLFRSQNGNGRTVVVRGHHGWGGNSRTEGADITKFSHDVKFWQSDVFLYGHVHKLKCNDVEEGRITGNNKWATFKKRMLVCGTYQRTYSNTTTATWAETKGFQPTSIGHPKIFIRPNKEWVEMKVQL